MVFLNGVPTAVSFNDGDTFRVIEGPLEGTRARLAGFNTLESHGPAHQWGDWSPKELYALAKMATLNARRGVWHCESKDMDRDGYGRALFFCPDLAQDQIRNGYALALTVDEKPAIPAFLAAQREAQLHRRGIWAKGIPTFVVTSIHSADEGFGDRTYNRLVSTIDGHSEKWKHGDVYDECQHCCYIAKELSPAQAYGVVQSLRRDPEASGAIRGVPDLFVAGAINEYLITGKIPVLVDVSKRQILAKRLDALRGASKIPEALPRKVACMIHVNFKRWYAQPKPACLKW